MDATAEVRAFNRFYTRQIGILDEHIGESPFSLPEARLLYEIATRERTTNAELSRALAVDPAHVSRLLQKLVAGDLVAFAPNPADRRSNTVALTREGRQAFAALDAASQQAVGKMLAPLDSPRRQALLAAMATIRRLLGEEVPDGPVVLRPHRIGELGWLIHRQGLLYNQQYGWSGEFEALIAGIYHEFEAAADDPPRKLWIAERAGSIAGSVFVMPSDGREGTAQLRMLYVEPEHRGQKIGSILVGQCVAFAQESGYRRIRLWTHSIQEAARRIYAAHGFERVEAAPHRSFGKELVSEIWEREL